MTGAVLAFCLVALTAAAQATPNVDWLLDYKNKSTSQLIWDKRSKRLIERSVPKAMLQGVFTGLRGPPDPVYVEENRYVSVSACAAHFCLWRGFLWVDVQTGKIVAGYHDTHRLQLGSKTLPANAIPKPALKAIRRWLKESRIDSDSAVFCDASGKTIRFDGGAITPPDEFAPSLKGPSFDCARASSRIERTICADGELALMDVRLYNLYQEIRHGQATLPARAELHDFQTSWLSKRDAECADAEADCLKQEYEAQYTALSNWVSTR